MQTRRGLPRVPFEGPQAPRTCGPFFVSRSARRSPLAEREGYHWRSSGVLALGKVEDARQNRRSPYLVSEVNMPSRTIAAFLFCLFCGCADGDPELSQLRRYGRTFIDEARAFERAMEKNPPPNELREHAQRTRDALTALVTVPDSGKSNRTEFRREAVALNSKLLGCQATGSPDNASDLNSCRFDIGKLERALEDLK